MNWNIKIFYLLGLIFLRFCLGLEINSDCLIVPHLKHMINVDSNNYMQDRHKSITYEIPHRLKRLFLMPSLPFDDEHAVMNKNLIIWGRYLGFAFETVNIPITCSYDDQFYYLTTTETLSKHYDIINLKVNIPFNYLEISEGRRNKLSLVGYTYTENKKQEVCKSIPKNKDNGDYENCKHTTENITVLYGKLISKNIKSYKILYEILNNIDPNYNIKKHAYWKRYKDVTKNEPIKRHSIIICANANHQIEDFGYRTGVKRYNRHIIYDCDNVNDFIEHDVLAVIAPKPFKNEESSSLPVVFYDEMTPYLLPKDTVVYPSSTTLYGNYFQEMSYRLLQFIRFQSWNRIAIVTDNSLYSLDFENLMTNLFEKNSLVYSAHQCSGLICNFDEALKWLKNADTRIIIANVDKKYARKLMNSAKKNKLTTHDKVIWIFRSGSLEDFSHNDIYDNVNEILYISVSPEEFASISSKEKTKREIIKALSYFEDAIINKENKSAEIQKYASTLMKDIEELQNQTVIYIRKVTLDTDEVVFNSTNKQNPFLKKVGYTDQDQDCSLRSFGYVSVCEDTYPLIIMLVILTFLLAVLCIIIFFRMFSPHARNYRPI